MQNAVVQNKNFIGQKPPAASSQQMTKSDNTSDTGQGKLINWTSYHVKGVNRKIIDKFTPESRRLVTTQMKFPLWRIKLARFKWNNIYVSFQAENRVWTSKNSSTLSRTRAWTMTRLRTTWYLHFRCLMWRSKCGLVFYYNLERATLTATTWKKCLNYWASQWRKRSFKVRKVVC